MNRIQMMAGVLGLLLSVVIDAYAQPELQWTRSFRTANELEFPEDLAITADGGYITCGYTDSAAGAFVTRISANGELLWSQTYAGESRRWLLRIAVEGDGYVVFGKTDGDDIWLLRIDDEGEIQDEWEGREGQCWPKDMAICSDGSYVICGETNPSDWSPFLAKYDQNFELVWWRDFDLEGRYGWAYNFTELADGGFALAINQGLDDVENDSLGNGGNERDGMIIRTDEEGREVWTGIYGGEGFDYLTDVVERRNGDLVAVGGFNGGTAWLLHVDSNGEMIGQSQDQNRFSHPQQMCFLEDETVVIANYGDYVMLKRQTIGGGDLWVTDRLASNRRPAIPKMFATSDHGYIVLYATSDGDVGLLKLAPDGLIGFPQWIGTPNYELNEDEDSEFDLFDLDPIITDDMPIQDLVFSVENSEFVTVELNENLMLLMPRENWWGNDSFRISITDEDEQSTSTWARVHISSSNDPPQPFALLSPEDGSEATGNQIPFMWDESAQIEMETDTSRYSLRIWNGENAVVIDSLSGFVYLLRGMEDLRSRLGIGSERTECNWNVTAFDSEAETVSDTTFRLVFPATTDAPVGSPAEVYSFGLKSLTPNPFNSRTTIAFSLSRSSDIVLGVTDLYGRQVARLAGGNHTAGSHSVTWDASTQPSGIYLVRLESIEGVRSGKVTLIR